MDAMAQQQGQQQLQQRDEAARAAAAEQEAKDRAAMEAGKDKEEFRNYNDSFRHAVVERHYRLMRTNQTVDFVRRMHEKYNKFDHAKMTIADAFKALESYVDSSDPDTELPNLEHMMQTAERIRKAGFPEWFQLVGLLHDMGKIMFLWGTREDGQEGTATGDQWALGGDTWAVGCKIPDSVVFPEFNALNKDSANPELTTELGMYEAQCGLDNLLFAYGHDEYMYQMLKFNKCAIPDEGLAIIRYHSAYTWHTGGAYKQFETSRDEWYKEWVLKFNKYDLYTKSDERPDVKALWPYYQGLIDRFCPGELCW